MKNRRIMAVVTALALVVSVMPLTAGAEGQFSDDDGNVHEANIEKIAALGITKGCNPPTNDLFCPGDEVTRGQMAAFLVRTLDLTETSGSFSDISGNIFEQDILKLAHAGITKGCNPPDNTLFCPDDVVTRGQMAAFLVRALELTDFGDAAFVDDDGSIFETDIEKLAHAGITRGCNPPDNTMFCPDDPVLRDQMATFLSRAYDIHVTGTTTTTEADDTTTSTTTGESTTTTVEDTTTTTEDTTTTTSPPPEAWSTDPTDMSPGLVSTGYAKDGTALYVAGGKTNGTNRVASFQQYDMDDDDWTTLADVPGAPREDIALTEHDGWIYAFGGATTDFDSGDSMVAAAYNPSTGWEDAGVAELPAGVSAAQAVSWNGDIWIIGGFDIAGNSLAQVLVYSDPDGPLGPTVGTYTPGPSLPQGRDTARVAVQDGGTANDRLYVIGGRLNNDPVLETRPNTWRLSLTNDAWDALDTMDTPRRGFVVGVVADKIQVFGGENEIDGAIESVEEYDPATNTWTTLTGYDWPTPRHGAAGAQAQVGGQSIVFLTGGATTAGADFVTGATDSFNRANVLP